MQILRIIIIGATLLAIAAALPDDAVSQHRHADAVLLPLFAAAINEWREKHPLGDEQHFYRYDKADHERLELANKRWIEFYQASRK